MKNFKKGFTLIELLVVVAIIGILASVVLASLNSARAKGKDASAEASISSVRAQAEIFYSSTEAANSYTGICDPATNADSKKVDDLITAANKQVPAAGAFTCIPGTDSYTVAGTLNNTHTFCVDSTGYAGEEGNFVPGTSCK